MTGGITVDEGRERGRDVLHSQMALQRQGTRMDSPSSSESKDVSYAKQQLGRREVEGKLLGLPWNRETGTCSVALNVKHCNTKRKILSEIARVYDPLGLVSPTTLVAKLLYRDICDAKMTWDGQLPDSLSKRSKDWRDSLTKEFTIPRPLMPYHIADAKIELHSFGNASSQGVCAAVYAVVCQEDEVTQELVCAKWRIAKRNLTITRLELVAGHMAVDLASNVEAALSNYEVGTHCWLHSTVALYWIKGRGDYRQFVPNRVQKIQQHST